jgi:hypothetical protein
MCTVPVTNSGKASACVTRHARRGRRRFASDVSSTASSRYRLATPHATAPVRHDDAIGTSTSATPKCTYESAISAATWTPTNTVANPPR